MNQPPALKNLLQDSIDKDLLFAVFRLPNEVGPQYILQTNPVIESPSELNKNTEGFIMTQFQRELPAVWIRNDVYIDDFDTQIVNLNKINYNKSFEQYNNLDISKNTYLEKLESLIKDINDKKAEKVVYSRVVTVDLASSKIAEAFLNLLDLHTDAMVFLVHLPGGITWIGASPEVLISERNLNVKSMALAATRKTGESENWNEKEMEEQQYVSDFLEHSLNSLDIDFKKSDTYSRKLNSGLMHLCTDFSFKLNSREQLPTLLNKLHPTPAVCGIPRDSAKSLIEEYEDHKREYYTGYLGPLNINHSSDLFVNLRSAKCFNGKACLYVGGGITSASDSESEWIETILKSETILKALN